MFRNRKTRRVFLMRTTCKGLKIEADSERYSNVNPWEHLASRYLFPTRGMDFSGIGRTRRFYLFSDAYCIQGLEDWDYLPFLITRYVCSGIGRLTVFFFLTQTTCQGLKIEAGI